MMPFENYEDFCKAFEGDSASKARAELLLFMQDWIIRLATEDEDSIPISELLEKNADKSSMRDVKLDGLSKIISECDPATRHIADNMRENIIRENVKLPVYQVKEVNSYGLNWLSRRPGRTIKEKISNSTSIMAVRRRMSLDTGENRLYVAFLRELNDILETKHKYLSTGQITEVEKEFWVFINSVLYKEELEDIGRWENMPPNNTLLSDQYYKKVWKGWESLKSLDRQIEDDNRFLSERLCVMTYIEFLSKARGVFRIPQVPITVDYDDYEVLIESPLFYLIDDKNIKLEIIKEKTAIRFEYKNKFVVVSFNEDKVTITTLPDDTTTLEFSLSKIFRIVDLLFVRLGISIKELVPKKSITKRNYQSVTMDLFQLHPAYISESGNVGYLQGSLALQQFGRVDLPCDDTNALIIQAESMVPYSIQSAVIDNSLSQLGQLMHLLEEQIITNDFTYVFPDAFDEFQLSLVHKAARMAYRRVRSFPRSIGVAFDYQTDNTFAKVFDKDDFLLVVDIVDDDVVFTLVQGLDSEDVKREYPDYKGYVWERHPSTSYSIDAELNELYDQLKPTGFYKYPDKIFESFGIEGVIDARNSLSIIYDDSYFSFDGKIADLTKKLKVNISDKVNKFLFDHRDVIGGAKVHIISLSTNITYKGTCSFIQVGRERALRGCQKYEEHQKNTQTLLWRDHLPKLAIKQLYGKFMLVDNETITPEFNVKKHIRIDREFTLPANGKTEYRFDLVQSDSNKKTRFVAVVRSSAFPLTENTPCTLDMTYEYGAENPYVLFFRPGKDCLNPKFIEGKVTWEKISEYPMLNLPFPQFAAGKTWEELMNYAGKRGTEDLIYGQRGIINSFESIQVGYSTVDLSEYEIRMKTGKNGRSFSIEAQTQDGDPINILFFEKNVESNRLNIPSVNFDRLGVVSFDLSESTSRNKRYDIDLMEYADYYGNIWKEMARGHACFIELEDDELDPNGSITVALFENQFDHPERFNTGITHVSFEVQPPYQGKYRAVKIHDEDADEPYAEPCWASSIRKGDKPGFFTYSGRIYFLMHTIFSGKNSIYNDACPEDLRQAFKETIEPWKDEYYRCDDEFVKSRIFGLMSIVGPEIGAAYFDIAHENVDRYMSNEKFLLNDYVGYGLGDFTLPEEVGLFEDIQELPDDKVICILSKAVWGNPDFLWNFPINLTMRYFEKSIDRIGELINEVSDRRVGKDITLCLEYILAVYRLRERYGDNQNIMRILSQNTKKIQSLYEHVEKITDMVRDDKLDIKCMLSLEFTDKGVFNDIPNLLYALLICITGNSKADDIMIAGLSMDDLEV